ncbi:MAG: FAD-binding oxidoreductase [Pseudomonadales bacterium]|nr:FAD-binding oxidoreductase [Pseudomonadales bacterium]
MSIFGNILSLLFDSKQTQTPVATRELKAQKNKATWDKMAANPVTTQTEVIVADIQNETDSIRTLSLTPSLAPSDTAQKPVSQRFHPGQFITCEFEVNGKKLKRAYSITSAEQETNTNGKLQISVKKEINGVVSNYIHDDLQVGDRFLIQGPSGDFVLPDSAERIVMIAGGVGITPFISQLRSQPENTESPGPEILLIYCCETPEDTAFRNELNRMARSNARLTVKYIYNHGQDAKRLSPEKLRLILEDWCSDPIQLEQNSTRFLLCGPAGLMEMAQESLSQQQVITERGIPSENILREAFFTAGQQNHKRPQSEQPIYFRRTNKTVTARPGQSILDAALQGGLEMQFSCQVGGCGHCKIKVHKGDVYSDEPNCLSSNELNAGYRLACLSYAASPLEIDA